MTPQVIQEGAGIAIAFLQEHNITLPYNKALELSARMQKFVDLHHAQEVLGKQVVEKPKALATPVPAKEAGKPVDDPEALLAIIASITQQIENHTDLASYAAVAALRKLAYHWEDHLCECPPSIIYTDINDTIERLYEFLREIKPSIKSENSISTPNKSTQGKDLYSLINYVHYVCSQHDEWWIGEFSNELKQALVLARELPLPSGKLRSLDGEALFHPATGAVIDIPTLMSIHELVATHPDRTEAKSVIKTLRRLSKESASEADRSLIRQYCTSACENYADDDITIDPNPQISESNDGAFVQAWVWVNREDIGVPFDDVVAERSEKLMKVLRLLNRDDFVRILEEHGIQCYDSESYEVLMEALRINVLDGTISESVLNPNS